MTALALELDGGSRWRPGDAVSGSVVVTEGGKSRSLEVSVAFVNRTSDYREPSIVISSAPLHEGELVTGSRFPFQLALPPDAPPPYMAPWGRLYWEVEARSDQFVPVHARQEVVIAADGVPLPSGPPSEPAATQPAPPRFTTVIPPVGAPPQKPGWYPDPWFRWRLRYWDGARWTADVVN